MVFGHVPVFCEDRPFHEYFRRFLPRSGLGRFSKGLWCDIRVLQACSGKGPSLPSSGPWPVVRAPQSPQSPGHCTWAQTPTSRWRHCGRWVHRHMETRQPPPLSVQEKYDAEYLGFKATGTELLCMSFKNPNLTKVDFVSKTRQPVTAEYGTPAGKPGCPVPQSSCHTPAVVLL